MCRSSWLWRKETRVFPLHLEHERRQRYSVDFVVDSLLNQIIFLRESSCLAIPFLVVIASFTLCLLFPLLYNVPVVNSRCCDLKGLGRKLETRAQYSTHSYRIIDLP